MRYAAALLVALLPLCAFGAWNPQGWERPSVAAKENPVAPGAVVAEWLLSGYRGNLSPLDGPRCPSFPTCSTYAVQAVRLHGPLAGAILTASRLVSEADEGLFAPYVIVDGEHKVWYPVEPTLILKERP